MQRDVVGAGVQVLLDPGVDGVEVAPGDQGVDEAVAAASHKVGVGESEPAQVALVGVQAEEEADAATGDLAGPARVGVQDDGQVWGEQGVVAEVLAVAGGGLGGHEEWV